jgi:hypothetical protein
VKDQRESATINRDDISYQAAVCERCGVKVFPVELLDAHLDKHALKDLYFEGELQKLKWSMARMR